MQCSLKSQKRQTRTNHNYVHIQRHITNKSAGKANTTNNSAGKATPINKSGGKANTTNKSSGKAHTTNKSAGKATLTMQRGANTNIIGPLLSGLHFVNIRPKAFNLRSDFVNVWRHARLVVYIFTCDSCILLLRSYTLICLMIWCLFRGLVLLFRSSLDWLKQDVTVSVWRMFWSFKALLAPRGKGPFCGCYWITSFEWP